MKLAAMLSVAIVLVACDDKAAQDAQNAAPPEKPLQLVEVANRARSSLDGRPAHALYASADSTPLWVDRNGKPTKGAREAIAALLGAADEGLDSAAYSAAALSRRADSLDATRRPGAEVVAAFDADLSRSLLQYLTDLHNGRVDPRSLGLKLTIPKDEHELAAMVRTGLAKSSIEQLVKDLEPPLALYRRLRTALGQYRELAVRHADWPALAPPRQAIKPGMPYPDIATVAGRLRILGDLDGRANTGTDSATYDPQLADAVKRFQDRHGLEPDGVIGKSTIVALNVPPAVRASQIALSLERLRWLPDLDGRRFIVVNIPSYHLWAWDSTGTEGVPSIDMGVIVGKRAVDTRTPVFVDDMRYLIFRPYWNVPLSIARNEIVPAAMKDHTYLARQDMEIVKGQSDGSPVVESSKGNLEKVAKGELRVRQRPGERNALGLVKFIFPNDANVYLHGTPAQSLFNRASRDFSHGCVRVEQPVDLAEWVLRDVEGWDRGRILAAMEDNKSTRVDLKTPVRVVLFYTTALARLDGQLEFADDIYGHDTRLLEAMR
jgi:murein L,D-transpeptidase YcbB/YkuD